MRKALVAGAVISFVAIAAATPDPARAETCLLDSDHSGTATGEDTTDGATDNSGHDSTLACGRLSRAEGIGATALGTGADARGDNASATGYNAFAETNSVAFGAYAKANKSNTIAVGVDTTADGQNGTAIGHGAYAEADSVALGANAATSNTNAVAVGGHSTAGQGGTAVGDWASSGGFRSVALGGGASATATGAIAIGSDSLADVAEAVSVGNATLKRKIVNVADGFADSDVATVGQVDRKITSFEEAFLASGEIESTIEDAQFFTELTGRVDTAESNLTGLRRDVDSHTATIATNRTGIATNTTAIEGLTGRVDTAETDITSLKRHFGTIDPGATSSLALGAGSVAQSSNTVSFGRAESSPGAGDAYTRRLTNIADGIDPSDAATVGQLAALNGTVASFEGQVNDLFDLAAVDRKDTRQGLAAVAAMADPHFPSEVGKTSYASNVATHRGEFGISAGLMHRIKGNLAITAGATFAGGDSATFRGGVAGEF